MQVNSIVTQVTFTSRTALELQNKLKMLEQPQNEFHYPILRMVKLVRERYKENPEVLDSLISCRDLMRELIDMIEKENS